MSDLDSVLLAVAATCFVAWLIYAALFFGERRRVECERMEADRWFEAFRRASTDLHAARTELAKRPLPQLRAPDGRYVSGSDANG